MAVVVAVLVLVVVLVVVVGLVGESHAWPPFLPSRNSGPDNKAPPPLEISEGAAHTRPSAESRVIEGGLWTHVKQESRLRVS